MKEKTKKLLFFDNGEDEQKRNKVVSWLVLVTFIILPIVACLIELI